MKSLIRKAWLLIKRTRLKLFKLTGLSIMPTSVFLKYKRILFSELFYNQLSLSRKKEIAKYLPFSSSQIAQDIFVLSQVDNLKDGLFVSHQ